MAKQIDKSKMKCNTPKRTPSHATKSHVVKACEGGKEKIIRFGQQGVKGSPPKRVKARPQRTVGLVLRLDTLKT